MSFFAGKWEKPEPILRGHWCGNREDLVSVNEKCLSPNKKTG
jgi:hypothetical protein